MSVEQLVDHLKDLPKHYEVKAFFGGGETNEDFEGDILEVQIDPMCKHVLIEFDNKFLYVD